MFTRRQIKGYTLVEMILYMSILFLISLVAVGIIISFSQSYATLSAERSIEHSGIDGMERMVHEIRLATSVDTTNSSFGTTPGVLTLTQNVNGTVNTVKFYLQNNILRIDVNGSFIGPLTVSSTPVTSLVFTHLTNGTTEAVKIDMTVQTTVGAVTKSNTYHDTAVLTGQ